LYLPHFSVLPIRRNAYECFWRLLRFRTHEGGGFIKAIVNADTKQILGAAVLGIEGGEIMAAFEVAYDGATAIHPLA
jgi:pyruvate/2-oxoglutarate dehydrogenase complex dihydrolipoamide dehydrogenase (E3) component